MRRQIAALVATALVYGPALAGEVLVKGPEILTMLRGAEVTGETWSQSFLDGGATIYTSKGNQSSGRWDVRGDQYCSVWPPSDVWACYDMTFDATSRSVTWISADGARASGLLKKKVQ